MIDCSLVQGTDGSEDENAGNTGVRIPFPKSAYLFISLSPLYPLFWWIHNIKLCSSNNLDFFFFNRHAKLRGIMALRECYLLVIISFKRWVILFAHSLNMVYPLTREASFVWKGLMPLVASILKWNVQLNSPPPFFLPILIQKGHGISHSFWLA